MGRIVPMILSKPRRVFVLGGYDAAKAKEGWDRAKQRMHDTREMNFEDFKKSLASVSAGI